MMNPSPVNATKVPKPGRHQCSDDILHNGIDLLEDFDELHLKAPPILQRKQTRRIATFVADLRRPVEANSNVDVVYERLCNLLNAISDEIYTSLPQDNLEKLVFIDHHTSPLSHHPDKGIIDKPDVIAVLSSYFDRLVPEPGGWYYRVPWHRSHSPVEWKGQHDNASIQQVLAYAAAHSRARPDNPGVYALSASPSRYFLVWSDPSEYASAQFPWTNIQPLIGYVYSLYSPPDGHNLCDPSITLEPSGSYDPPKWEIQFNGITYSNCEAIWVGAAWSRMTWVARSTGDPGKVIKDSYRSIHRSYRESELIDLIHESGRVGGWVVRVDSNQVERQDGPIRTSFERTRRVKQRLIMDSVGEILYRCGSVFHFLKVMYDVLEAHRWAADKRKVLHRDISINNILVNPKVPPFEPSDDRPKFIEEILDQRENAPSLALLCDLDNGCTFEPLSVAQCRRFALSDSDTNTGNTSSLKEKEDTRNRTGTPLFISRSVCVGSVLTDLGATPVSMPVLKAEAGAVYIQVHATDQLRAYQDAGKTHGGSYDAALYQRTRKDAMLAESLFFPQPRHDAESVFWIIVIFLLRALPAKPSITNDDVGPLQQLWPSLSDHSIPQSKRGYVDSRKAVLGYVAEDWRDILHPDLADEAQLLEELNEQVIPEYAYLDPQPPFSHLHEAMQRILLNHLWNMSKEKRHVDLDQSHLREVPDIIHTKQSFTKKPKKPTPGIKGRSDSLSQQPSSLLKRPLPTSQSQLGEGSPSRTHLARAAQPEHSLAESPPKKKARR